MKLSVVCINFKKMFADVKDMTQMHLQLGLCNIDFYLKFKAYIIYSLVCINLFLMSYEIMVFYYRMEMLLHITLNMNYLNFAK